MKPGLSVYPVSKSLLAGALLVSLLAAAPAGAATPASELEGVWSYNNGSVAIKSLANGTLQGTVVKPTEFGSCPHAQGEVIWTDIKAVGDGSYQGYHQWFRGANCEAAPEAGQTAWRVLKRPDGSRQLEVCFSTPGSDAQPEIAPDGAASGDTYGCYESALIAPLATVEGGSGSSPSQPTFAELVTLPETTTCVSRSRLTIKLENSHLDPLKEVVVKVNGKKTLDVKSARRLKTSLTLRKLPTGSVNVRVVATTGRNEHLSGSQTYRSCTNGSGEVKLSGVSVAS